MSFVRTKRVCAKHPGPERAKPTDEGPATESSVDMSALHTVVRSHDEPSGQDVKENIRSPFECVVKGVRVFVHGLPVIIPSPLSLL